MTFESHTIIVFLVECGLNFNIGSENLLNPLQEQIGVGVSLAVPQLEEILERSRAHRETTNIIIVNEMSMELFSDDGHQKILPH